MPTRVSRWLALLCFCAWPLHALSGGGGVLQQDRCVVEMGFLKAHLTIYQPQTQANTKYCDSIPDLTNTVFVLDYLHESLNDAPIEFRIIEDTKELGRFARWRDVTSQSDIDEMTVFHQPPTTISGGSFKVEHELQRPGNYLIVLTAGHPTKDETYHAVAPLEVGGAGWLYWVAIPMAAAGVGFGLVLWRVRGAGQPGASTASDDSRP